MNNRGQFLVYDILLAAIILLLALAATTYLLENINTPINENQYKESTYILNTIEDQHLLKRLSIALDNNNTEEVIILTEKIEYLLNNSEYNYTLTDESINKTLINHNHTHKEEYSSRKIVNNHTYTLKIYKN